MVAVKDRDAEVSRYTRPSKLQFGSDVPVSGRLKMCPVLKGRDRGVTCRAIYTYITTVW